MEKSCTDEFLRESCKIALNEKYGERVPPFILKRYESELENIISYGFSSNYIYASMLAKKSRELGYSYSLRGYAGNSFIVYLLDISEVNPLPPHYYCPTCKWVKSVDSEIYSSGFDLNSWQAEYEVCPFCGAPIFGDGHNLPVEFFAGYDGSRIPDFGFNFAPEIVNDMAAYLKDIAGEYIFEIFSCGTFSKIKQMEEKAGIDAESIRIEDFDIFSAFDGNRFSLERMIITDMLSTSFSDLVSELGADYVIYRRDIVMETFGENEFDASDEFVHPEDVMLTLIRHGIERETAFQLAEMVSSGKARFYLTDGRKAILRKHNIPEWYIEQIANIRQQIPKAQTIQDMIIYYRMVWFRVCYPNVYRLIVQTDECLSDNFFNPIEEPKSVIEPELEHFAPKGNFAKLSEVVGRVMQERFSLTAEDKMTATVEAGFSKHMTTGVHSIDCMLGSFKDGGLYIMGGRPAMGKTSFLVQTALNIAMTTKKPVFIQTLDLTAEEIVLRMISQISDVDQIDTGNVQLSEKEKGLIYKCWSIMDEMQVYICDKVLNMDEIRRCVEKEAGDGVLLVDYLQLIAERYDGAFDERISESLCTLKELAQEHEIPIIVASQLSRKPERRLDNRPRLRDIKADTYAIDRYVDGVILLYRYRYYFINGGNHGELILAKNQNGETGTAYVEFNEKKLKFEDSTTGT